MYNETVCSGVNDIATSQGYDYCDRLDAIIRDHNTTDYWVGGEE